MKVITLFRLTASALVALACLHSYAQPGGASASSDASSAFPTEKSTKATNRKLARSVSHTLGRSKALDASSISVRASSGAVTLEGTVPDASQIEQAAQIARGVSGVTSVKNALTIRAAGQ